MRARLQRNSPAWWRRSRSARQCGYCETKRATFWGCVGELDAPVHAELGGDGREGGAEGGFVEAGRVGGELDAHEEEAGFDILMLVGVEDVDVVGVDEEVDDGDDDALAVGAVDEQDGGLWMWAS